MTTDFGPTFGVTDSADFVYDIELQADGKIVAAGAFNNPYPSPSNVDIALARYEGDAPLQAASAAPNPSATILTYSQVQPLLSEALARWQASGVDVSGLGQLDIRITNLGGNYLGMTDGHTIWLDDNAAGWGWFVDPTPNDDSEFTTPGNQGEKHRMDLLTVLEHELGHMLGREHEESGVMAETLSAGERWTPSGVYVDGPRLFVDPSGGDETLDSVTGRRKGW